MLAAHLDMPRRAAMNNAYPATAFRVSMARYDVVVIGAGLGGLTAGAILARAGRKVLVIERSNSVGGAASSYKSGDLSSKARCIKPAIRTIPAILNIAR